MHDAALDALQPGTVDFANVLFAGPCNRDCPFCIGRLLPDHVNAGNLDRFPPANVDAFVALVNRLGVRQIVFTGTTTDPQLYRHEAALLAYLRARVHVPGGAQYSVHTNGVLALRRLEIFRQYNRACISFPSFVPGTYEKMMGSRHPPDLAAIIARAGIPVKVSCVVNEHNAGEVPDFLRRCRAIGVRRLVFRKLYGDTRDWPILRDVPVRAWFRRNPVYDYDGMEVTCWDFDASTCSSVNLFADGTLGTTYLLTATPQLDTAAA
jgi:MoaA/NifB/PqqE/SkfB family radical SAM enzyme